MPGEDSSRFTRRDFLKQGATVGAGLTLGVPMFNTLGRADDRPPNIVVVFADQMRAQAMGCMGNPQLKTPNMDRMARQGALFTNAYCGFPLCSPYRAMLLTGRYCQSNGVVTNDIALRNGEVTIAEVLKKQGYKTGYVGKWHLEWHREPFVPKDRRQGFDYWAVRNCAHDYFDSFVCTDTPDRVPLPGYEPDGQTGLAIDFMRECGRDPFCLFLSWGTPHNPYVAPKEYLAMYQSSQIWQRPNVQGDYQDTIARYYAMITNLDDNLGRLLGALDELGIAQDTIMVFTSDHGDMLGSQGHELKQRPWEESIHVPFILRYPGKIKAGSTIDVMTNSVDVMPTLLSLAGVPIPGNVQGLDLSRFPLGKTGSRPKSVFLQNIYPCDHALKTNIGPWRGVRTPRYTYVRWRDAGWVLYDNAADPYQLNNLIDNPEAREIQEVLEKDLQGWLDRTGDDFASTEEWKKRILARWKAEGTTHKFRH